MGLRSVRRFKRAGALKGFPLYLFSLKGLALTFLTVFVLAVLLLQPLSAQQAAELVVHVAVTGSDGKPLAGSVIEGFAPGAEADATTPDSATPVCKAVADDAGHADLHCKGVQEILLSVEKDGYLVSRSEVSAQGGRESVADVVLQTKPAVNQSIVVQAETESPVEQVESSTTTVSKEQANATSLRPVTLTDALPLVPGVIRTPDGRVQIAGLTEDHSALIINSVGVNDPATGNFGLSVPVDTVDSIQVMQSPYLAQYGNFIAGVVSAETKRGGDKWGYSLNDPLPDFRIRSGHLVGLQDATPRLNFDGPLIRNRLYVSEGSEYLMHKDEVRTLPFPDNQARSNAFNSFSQMDWEAGARNSVTATLHFAPHTMHYEGLNYFDPEPVTPNANYQEDTGTIRDRLAIGGGLLSSTFAGTRVASNISAQDGSGTMTLSPTGDTGNYFGQQTREATRFQWIETWNPKTIESHGQHELQFGSVIGHAEDAGYVAGRDVNLLDANGALIQTISFSGNGAFDLADLEMAAYGEDHWILNSRFAADYGLRVETQSLTYTTRVAPRVGFTWSPHGSETTVIRGGAGVFYDNVPLDTYAFGSFPEQVITTYDGAGNVVDGPRTYLNLTGTEAKSQFPFIHQDQHSGDFAPYSVAWNVEGDRAINRFLRLRARYIQADAQNQLTLTPTVTSKWNAMVLGTSGSLHTRQAEFTAKMGDTKNRQFYFSYVRQFARGEFNDAASYLGDFPYPVIRTPISASTTGEIPNRFMLWGLTTLPWKMRIAPHIEWRDGFPWQPMDEFQNYVAPGALQPRYPRYFSADARIGKDLPVGSHHAGRLSITVRNLTNHNNPLQVHDNVADPLYGTFFGNYGRHFLADFDILF
ncbi:TonB-dependent receptor plug domain-containing protein [Acidicapsa dinghuensis]|uniref:TonB-dependent receptor plug domain-containing protein n=1 Tax=Acidicapsa dinghuensis TaxID=2218256 RepID=A0ABW1EPJ5_9BACT|nr:TonB-dependent receptor plug domain-containing protein [Acidicapsa dinghuensis]